MTVYKITLHVEALPVLPSALQCAFDYFTSYASPYSGTSAAAAAAAAAATAAVSVVLGARWRRRRLAGPRGACCLPKLGIQRRQGDVVVDNHVPDGARKLAIPLG